MGAYTIAFVPKGVKVPPPPGAAQIQQNAQIDAGDQNTGSTVPQTLPPDTTPPSETTAPGSGTTAPGSDSAPETTATTNPTG